MGTLANLVDNVIDMLTGYTMIQDASASALAPVNSGDVRIQLDDVSNFGRGAAEIDSELVYVSSVDALTNTLILAPWGRGYRGSEAVAHAAGARVTMSPQFPRAGVARAVNQAIMGLYPNLYGVRNITLLAEHNSYAYDLGDKAERVLAVRYRASNGDRLWEPAKKWDVLHAMPTSDFPSGNALEIYDYIRPGTTISVAYSIVPKALESGSQQFVTSGLPAEFEELVILGAAWRMLPALDAGRLPRDAATAVEADAVNQVGTAGEAAKTIYSLYSQRLAEAQALLSERYPAKFRRVR